MNYSDRYLRQIASYSTVDVMLADVAIRIQLSPTDYQLAVDHYHAIHEWLEREDSPLFGQVLDFYPQGGFAIGATVARHSTDDEFDIDVMAQLAYSAHVDPESALATLERSAANAALATISRPTARRVAAPSTTTACIST
jgi:hypothetical protein